MVEGKKFLQFDADRKLTFDPRRPLGFTPDRERLFDPNRALSFDSSRPLGFGVRGTVFRGNVCPNCQTLAMAIETVCPQCGNSLTPKLVPKAPQQQRPYEHGQQQQQPAIDVRPVQQPQSMQPPRPMRPPQPMAPPAQPPQRQAPPSAASATGQVVCPNCALTLPAQTVFCPRCGVNIQQWRQYLMQMAARGQNKGGQYGAGQYGPPGR
jgi:RNA polymerase subunit RPABC4/transcription elongation factor Spt4